MFTIAKICTECFALESLEDDSSAGERCGVCGGPLAGPVAFPEDQPSPRARSGLLTSAHYKAIRSVVGERDFHSGA